MWKIALCTAHVQKIFGSPVTSWRWHDGPHSLHRCSDVTKMCAHNAFRPSCFVPPANSIVSHVYATVAMKMSQPLTACRAQHNKHSGRIMDSRDRQKEKQTQREVGIEIFPTFDKLCHTFALSPILPTPSPHCHCLVGLARIVSGGRKVISCTGGLLPRNK